MVARLSNVPLKVLKRRHGFGKDLLAEAVQVELNGVTREEVKEYYAKCYSFLKHWKALSSKHKY